MNDRRKGTGFWAGVILGCIIATPFAYLLLLGPVAFLSASGTLTQADWNIAAYPLICWKINIGIRPEWLWHGYESYLQWWAGLAGMD